MRDQSLAIRVREIVQRETSEGREITDADAIARVLNERGTEYMRTIAVEAVLAVVKDRRPPSVPEPTEAMFDPAEPIRVPDGENGYLWVPADLATVGQHQAANDDACQYHRGQLKARERAAVDIQKVADFADGDLTAGYRSTLRALRGATDE